MMQVILKAVGVILGLTVIDAIVVCILYNRKDNEDERSDNLF